MFLLEYPSASMKNSISLPNGSVANEIGAENTDAVRKVVIKLFQSKRTIKKGEVVDACMEVLGRSPSATEYSRVMQEFGTSRGGTWTFKQ